MEPESRAMEIETKTEAIATSAICTKCNLDIRNSLDYDIPEEYTSAARDVDMEEIREGISLLWIDSESSPLSYYDPSGQQNTFISSGQIPSESLGENLAQQLFVDELTSDVVNQNTFICSDPLFSASLGEDYVQESSVDLQTSDVVNQNNMSEMDTRYEWEQFDFEGFLSEISDLSQTMNENEAGDKNGLQGENQSF